ncbi:hypothetical protein DFH09DRAFT_1343678 [Mycena vulgaris]|nr:hypothetical protein DFH09DRAFT_1343678 [Mycena vulgaris]
MSPTPWASPEQLTWLTSHVGQYHTKRASGDQIEFFAKLDEGWFAKWSAEEECKLPASESGEALTPEQSAMLAALLTKRKKQLRSWFRNHATKLRESGTKPAKKDDKISLVGTLWQETKRHRDPQRLELWLKAYPERAKASLEAAGYYTQHAGDLEWVSHDGQRPPEGVKRKLKEQASARMTMWRRVTVAAFEAESDAVKEEMEAELQKIKAAKLSATADAKLTPELAQMSIHQLEGIIDRIHALIMEKTGWKGFTMLGGPTPNEGGALSYTVYSCGFSPAGNSFKESHPEWGTAVAEIFSEWLKRCFNRSARDAMALADGKDILEDLLPMEEPESDDAEREPGVDIDKPAVKPKPAVKKVTPAMKPPKRKKAAESTSKDLNMSSATLSTHSSALPSSPESSRAPLSTPLDDASSDSHFTSFSLEGMPSAAFSFPSPLPALPTPASFSFSAVPSTSFDSTGPAAAPTDFSFSSSPSISQSQQGPVPESFSFGGVPSTPFGQHRAQEWFAAPASPLEPNAWGLGGDYGGDAWNYGPTDPMDLPKGMGDSYLGGGTDELPDEALPAPLSPGTTAGLDVLMKSGLEDWDGQTVPWPPRGLFDIRTATDTQATLQQYNIPSPALTAACRAAQPLPASSTEPVSSPPHPRPHPRPSVSTPAASPASAANMTPRVPLTMPSPFRIPTRPSASQPAPTPLPSRPPPRPIPPRQPAPKLTVAPNSSPLPPRIARAANGSSIAISTSALARAMKEASQKRARDSEEGGDVDVDVDDVEGGDGRSDSSDDDLDVPLAGPDYPESRPMANPPKPYKKATGKRRGMVVAAAVNVEPPGDGIGRGGHGGRRGRGGRGGRGGARPVGRPRRVAMEEEGVDDAGAADGSGRRTRGGRAPWVFHQTYGDNGEIIPLPLDAEPVVRQRGRPSKASEPEEAPVPDLRNFAGPSDLVVLARLPGAPMPPIPETGRPGRTRKAPRNANDDLAVLEALRDRAAGQKAGGEDVRSTKKRKAKGEESGARKK